MFYYTTEERGKRKAGKRRIKFMKDLDISYVYAPTVQNERYQRETRWLQVKI